MRFMDKKGLIFVGLLLLGLWFLGISAEAGIGVSPSLFITDLPDDGTFTITVRNTGDSPIGISVIPAGLKLDAGGTVWPQESEGGLRAAAEVFHPQPEGFTLAGGAAQAVTIEVTPPEGAEGAIYGAIMVTEQAPQEAGTMVANVSRIVVPVLFTLPGPSRKAGEVTGIGVAQEVNGGPLEIKAMFRDTGNIHFFVTGKAFIEDEDGVEIAQISLGTHRVIPPGVDRQFSGQWKPEELPVGYYRVRAEFQIEDGPKVFSEKDKTFYVISSYRKVLQPSGEIVAFYVPKVAKNRPIIFRVMFLNKGNVEESPNGEIEVRNTQGEVVSVLPISAEEEIAPGSSGELSATLEEGLPQGEYTATAELEYGRPEYGEPRTAKAEIEFRVIEKEIKIVGEIVEFTVPSAKCGELIVPELLVKNTGNTDFEVEGLIELKNSKGKTVGQIPIPVTPIPVGETKQLSRAWRGDLPKGLYSAVATLIVEGEKILTEQASFVVK